MQAAERAAYHPKVDVQFQAKAWLDKATSVGWVQKTLKEHIESRNATRELPMKFLLLMDNIYHQRTKKYVDEVKALGGECAYGPENKTEGWQPIDAGHVASCVKELAKATFSDWMDKASTADPSETNWRRWDTGKVNCSEKRIMMTWIFGQAWERFTSDKYLSFRVKAFATCGSLLTIDGSGDNLVKVQGWEGSLDLVPPGTVLGDMDYIAKHYSRHAAFQFSDQLPGGDEEKGEDSSSSSDSEIDMSSDSSSYSPIPEAID